MNLDCFGVIFHQIINGKVDLKEMDHQTNQFSIFPCINENNPYGEQFNHNFYCSFSGQF